MIANRNTQVTLLAHTQGNSPASLQDRSVGLSPEAPRSQSDIAHGLPRSITLRPLFVRSAAMPCHHRKSNPQGKAPKPRGREAASRITNAEAIPCHHLQGWPQSNSLTPRFDLSVAAPLSNALRSLHAQPQGNSLRSLFDRSAATPWSIAQAPLLDRPQGNTPRIKAFRSGAAPGFTAASATGRAQFTPAASSLRGTQGCLSARGELGSALCQPAGNPKQARLEAHP